MTTTKVSTSENGAGTAPPLDANHVLNTFLSTIPVAAVYATDRRLQKGAGNLVPLVPAFFAQVDNWTNDKKKDPRLLLADLVGAALPMLLARAFK